MSYALSDGTNHGSESTKAWIKEHGCVDQCRVTAAGSIALLSSCSLSWCRLGLLSCAELLASLINKICCPVFDTIKFAFDPIPPVVEVVLFRVTAIVDNWTIG